MTGKIMSALIALLCISTTAMGDEVDDKFEKARRYLNDAPQTTTITTEQPASQVPGQMAGEVTVITWATQADSLRGNNGRRVTYLCPGGGTPSDRLWGTDLYTDDSSICTAAAHAGLIAPSGGGAVTIDIRPGASAYNGSSRNGIASRAYGGWYGSFVFVLGASDLPPVGNAQSPQSRTGTIESSWDIGGLTAGIMVLRQSGTAVEGNYPEDRGEITGTLSGNILTGYWIEDASAQRCTTPKSGRYFWGRIRVVFDGNRFTGTWGYCEAEPMTGWSGTQKP